MFCRLKPKLTVFLELAKSESERLMRQEEISKQAEAFAEDVKSTALRNQQEMKDEADAYVGGGETRCAAICR